MKSNLDHLKVTRCYPNTIKKHKVWGKCKLREYVIQTLCFEFEVSNIYYELVNEEEDIVKGMKVLLLKDEQNREEWFEFKFNSDNGQRVTRKYFGKQYKVFIQCRFESDGDRELQGDCYILYDHAHVTVASAV